MIWIFWALILMLQNSAFVLNSRARNSSNLWYHALTNLFSNGVWIVSQFLLVDQIVKIIREGSWEKAAIMCVFYVVCTLIGGLATHWFAMRHIESRMNRS